MFITEDLLTECLLLKDENGRDIYESVESLCKKFRVSKIITVPVMEGLVRDVNGKTMEIMSLTLNLNDYTVGADKGGKTDFFEDFDINYNQMLYLYETRCSGSLTKPFSAIVIEREITNVAG